MNDVLKISNQLCFSIYSLSKEITNQYRPLLDKLNLTYPQYLALLVLWEHEKLNVREIGELLHLDSGTLTPLLKRLEAKDMVKRKRCQHDERIVEVTLTEKGRELQKEAVCVPLQLMQQVKLATEEQEQLKVIINKLLNNIQK